MKKILRKIYYALPFKKQIFLNIKKHFVITEKIYKHLRFREPFLVKIDRKHSFYLHNDSIVENEIFWNGYGNCWEKASLEIWAKLSRKSKTIIDIGANNGVYSLVAAAMNGKAKIFSFEPNQLYIPSLKNNISVNEYQKCIFPVQLAVGEKTGVCEIDDYSSTYKKLICNTVSIDDYVKKNNLNKVNLIKIDVEHYEPYVVKGLLNTIEKDRPSIIIEILTEKTANKLYKMLERFDYLYFNINENRGLKKVDKLCKSDSFNFLLCTKEEASFLKII